MPLIGSNITGQFLLEKYCKEAICATFSGNKKVQEIFKTFYQSPIELQLAYQKVKVLELLLVLSQIEISHERRLSDFQPEQVELIHQIHDQLINNLEHRISIETLSKQYLMNPTTLKNMFKSIYGTSIAAHIREYRMEYAQKLVMTAKAVFLLPLKNIIKCYPKNIEKTQIYLSFHDLITSNQQL